MPNSDTCWDAPLAREIEVTAATEQRKVVLRTLLDGGNFVRSYAISPSKDDPGALLTVLLMEAARTGAQSDIDAATDQLERYLASKRLI